MLADLRNYQNIRLENAVKARTDSLEQILKTLETVHDRWIENLKKYRDECQLLKLYSNREIMTLILMLRTSNEPNPVRKRFLTRLYTFRNSNNAEEEENFVICTLQHYLRSLRISQVDLSIDRLRQLYQTHRIEPGTNADMCLQKLVKFIQEIFPQQQNLFGENKDQEDCQQYLVTMNSSAMVNNQEIST